MKEGIAGFSTLELRATLLALLDANRARLLPPIAPKGP